jgi:hypothetical protein
MANDFPQWVYAERIIAISTIDPMGIYKTDPFSGNVFYIKGKHMINQGNEENFINRVKTGQHRHTKLTNPTT